MMARRPRQGEHGPAAFHGEFHRRQRPARCAACDGERGGVDDRVARRKVSAALADRRDVAFDALEIGVRMDQFEFGIRRVARRRPFREEPGRRKVCGDGRNALRRLRMRDAAQMLRIGLIVDDDHRLDSRSIKPCVSG
jgi:hypothetical protein